MIYVAHEQGSAELIPTLRQIAGPAVSIEKAKLPAADFCFEGNGPQGPVSVGIERKTLHDMLNCIEDARYADQRRRMTQLYNINVLMVEGHWRPHEPNGFLMEGFNNGMGWGYAKFRSNRTMYSMLYRYLIGVASTGVHVCYTRSTWQCCYDVLEWYHYWNKPFHEHRSQREIKKVSIPVLDFKPKLVRKWANDISDVGLVLSEAAQRHFRTPIKLATADEMEWLKIPGIGVPTARKIVKEINGW